MQTRDLADLADLALAEVTRLGVEHADVRARQEDSESVQVRDDVVEGVSHGSSSGVGIRVIHDGAWGFAATSDGSADAVRRAAQQAVEVARASAMVRGRDGARAQLDERQPSVGTYTTPHERDPLEVPLSEKVDHLMSATATARDAAAVSYVEATTEAWRTATAYRDSSGGAVDQLVLQVGGGLAAYAIGGGEVQRRSYPNSFGGQYETGGWERVLLLDLIGGAADAARDAVLLLDCPDLPLREDAVLLLESSQLALQVHESVGHAVELDRILGSEAAYAGTSWVAATDRGSLRYGSPLMTVIADATTPHAMGTFGYDDEGVPAGQAPIVTDGVLTGYLTDRQSAAALGEQSNGTARADSWGAIPLIRMNNVSLQPREGDLASIVADTDDGVLMHTNRSWSIDDKRLNFQFGCEVAYEVRRGQIGRMYRNPTYAGRTPDFWGSCDALGGPSDWKVWGVPNCGKGQPSQTARVAHGASTGRFRATVGVR
ncbi:MAG: TldD/PmbA family protein [Frankiaceae bacterium]|nr:TldD/PmbA family protein [Frankiaceae bacterium]